MGLCVIKFFSYLASTNSLFFIDQFGGYIVESKAQIAVNFGVRKVVDFFTMFGGLLSGACKPQYTPYETASQDFNDLIYFT